ncbi:MAG: response regulator transcription factor [Proteobacteria bacterium]|nr:response regulator transcription factor [Pseudomonadota bacterium]
MKILVIDRDSLTTQLVRSKLESRGHTVVEEAVKNNALERIEREEFDAVLFDPAPLNNARPVVLGIRRAAKNYPYVVIMSHEMDDTEALKAGANDVMGKPLDAGHLEKIMENAARLTRLIARIGDETEDFPSAGGVIAKSAFNQLFLSAIDRADRYAERSFMVFIGIKNYADIIATDGAYAAEYATAKLSQYLVRLRRQSDIIAQTGRGEYCLMLQRPIYEDEPKEAANRFAEALNRLQDMCANDSVRVEVTVRLLDVPVGCVHAEHVVIYDKMTAMGRN